MFGEILIKQMTEQEVKNITIIVMVIICSAIVAGIILAFWYVKAQKKLFPLLKKNGGEEWEKIGKPHSFDEINPYSGWPLLKLVWRKNTDLEEQVEKVRKIVRKRFLIFMAYFIVMFVSITCGLVALGLVLSNT